MRMEIFDADLVACLQVWGIDPIPVNDSEIMLTDARDSCLGYRLSTVLSVIALRVQELEHRNNDAEG